MPLRSESYSKPGKAKFEIKFQTGSGYLVVDDIGRKVGGFFSNLNTAQMRRDSLVAEYEAKLSRKVRPCLCCQTKFMSEGIHNRLCDRCRQQSGGLV